MLLMMVLKLCARFLLSQNYIRHCWVQVKSWLLLRSRHRPRILSLSELDVEELCDDLLLWIGVCQNERVQDLLLQLNEIRMAMALAAHLTDKLFSWVIRSALHCYIDSEVLSYVIILQWGHNSKWLNENIRKNIRKEFDLNLSFIELHNKWKD